MKRLEDRDRTVEMEKELIWLSFGKSHCVSLYRPTALRDAGYIRLQKLNK